MARLGGGTVPAAAFPRGTLHLPADLVPYNDVDHNGRLPAALLTSIAGPGEMHHTAARAWNALVAAAPFKLTYTGTAYRSYDAQVALLKSRAVPDVPQGGSWQRTWNGHVWYGKPGAAAAASPGTSNHGLGLAIDVALDGYGGAAKPITPQLPWMVAHAATYGFAWESDSEPWHIRYNPGDNIPQAVLDFENPPAPPDPVQQEDTDMPFFFHGDGVGGLVAAPYTGNGGAVYELVNGARRHVNSVEKALRLTAADRKDASGKVIGPPYVEWTLPQAQVDTLPFLEFDFFGTLDSILAGLVADVAAVKATLATGVTATLPDVLYTTIEQTPPPPA